MRGGRYQQKAIDDVNSRNAEALFETRTVVEIREVEGRTRKEIEEKKEELRQLVGASYRDLIESADSILLMRQSCEDVSDNIHKMEEGFESLKDSISLSTVSPESDNERKRRESLFGLGGRVKYLVDTPEKIWGCLDEHMYLEGSQRYLRAKEVHSLLTGTATGSNELFATFPLLRHQWPLVETFKGQISQRSRDRLQETGLKVGDYAIALAATGIIDELPAGQIFSLFLETRKSWLRAHLHKANAGRERVRDRAPMGKVEKRSGNRSGETGIADLLQKGEMVGVISPDSETIAETLCQLAHMVQASLCHVGELFLEVSGKMPLLFNAVLAAPPGSQLFGGIPNPEREVKLWRAHREKLETTMDSLSAQLITDSCISWLQKCAGDIIDEGRLLLEHVKSGKELADVEQMVRDDLAKQTALNDSLEWLKSAFGGALDAPWDCLCGLLLKEPTSLWDVLFDKMFVSRMKAVVDAGFRGIGVDGPLDDILSSHGESEGIGRQIERLQLQDNGRFLGDGDLRSMLGLESGASAWKLMTDDKDSSLYPEVTKLKDKVDEGLREVLEDSLCFFQGPQSSSRTDELAPYIQEQCHQCMINIVGVLRDRLSSLSEIMNSTESSANAESIANNSADADGQVVGSNGKLVESKTSEIIKASTTVEKALFLGRLSAALAQHASYLPIILGPPAHWNTRIKAVGLKGSTGLLMRQGSAILRDHFLPDSTDRWYLKRGKSGAVADSDSSPKLKELRRVLRHQSVAAHSIWVRWSAEDLASSFEKDLQSDDCLSTLTPLKGWEETVLKQEEENGGVVEMKLALPAMPSAYLVSFLFAACQEIYRVGGHGLDRAVLRLFAWKLCEKAVAVYESFLKDPSVFSTRVSEKGLLQLLFDLRFLADVLSGGQDVKLETLDEEDGVQGGDLGAIASRWKLSRLQSDTSEQEMKNWVAPLLTKVLSKLDPIDWATYEPHLWENECRHYQRSAVLLGSLVQLNRQYTDIPLKPKPQGDPNVLNLTQTVPRFTLLPISTPNFSVGGGPGARTPRSLSQDDSVSALWELANGEDGYKFRSTDTPSQSSVVAARPLIKSLMGQVGSRFGEGLKLGILSDKSAAAISTFGDMLPVQAAGLFSSLSANRET